MATRRNGHTNGNAKQTDKERLREQKVREKARARVDKEGLLKTAKAFGIHPQTLKGFIAGCSVHRGTVRIIEDGLR